MNQLKIGAILSYLNILLTNILGLILTPFIVSSLGSSEYGSYTLIGSMIAYFSLLDFGIGDTVIRYVSKYRAQGNNNEESIFIGNIFKIYSYILFGILLIGILFYYNFENFIGNSFSQKELLLTKKMFLVLLFNLVFSLLGNIFLGYINAYEKFIYTRIISILKYIFRFIVIILILSYGGKALALVIIDTIINILFFTFNAIYCLKKINLKIKFSKVKSEFTKEVFGFAYWLFLLSLISNFQWQGGQILLGIITTPEKIGIYAIGVMLGTYYGSFSSAITSMFLPHATRLVVNNATPREITDVMIKVGKITSYVLMFILTGFLLIGKQFVILWVGEKYIDAYYIACIIMIVYTFPLVQSYANSILEAKQMVRYKVLIYIMLIFLGTLFSYFGYTYWGIIGVISSISVGWFLAFVLMNRFYINKLNMEIMRFYKEVFYRQIFYIIVLMFFGYWLKTLFIITNWFHLSLFVIIYSILFGLVYYFFILSVEEKKMFFKI